MSTHRDIDRGWAFAVLFASFLAYGIMGGLGYSTGIYYVAMLRQFKLSHSDTAWIISLFYTFFYLGGILSTRFSEKFGCRAGFLLGATLITFGSVAAAFATSYIQILLLYGCVVGIGHNFSYVNIVLVLAEYFHTYHTLAVSIAMSGNGVGLFFISYLLEYTVEISGWQISFLVSAALSAQYYVFGACFFPIKKKKLPESHLENSSPVEKNANHIIRDEELHRSKSSRDFEQEKYQFENDKAESLECVDEKEVFESTSLNMNKVSEQNDKTKRRKISVLKDVRLWLLCFTLFVLYLATITYFIIFKDLLIEIELTSSSALGLSLIGAGDVIGRLIPGFLSSIKKVNIIVLYTISIFTSSVVFFAHLYITEKYFLLFLSTMFGITYGVQNAAIAIVPVHLFGRELLSQAFGYMTFTIGISCLIGPPMMGALIDLTASYRLGLMFLSVNCLVASMCMLCIYFYTNYRTGSTASEWQLNC